MGLSKRDPRAFEKMAQKRTAARSVDAMKTKVRQFHHYRCCVCRRRTMVVHEHLARSIRGEVSLRNSFLACDTLDGGSCHPLLQQHRIRAYNTGEPDQDPRDFDATKPITVEIPAKYSRVIFADRPMPPHVIVLDDHSPQEGT